MKTLATTVFMIFLAGGGCSKPGQEDLASPAPSSVGRPEPHGIRVAIAQSRQLPDYFDIPARVQAEPARVVRVFPPVGGRLISVGVNPGEHVQKGQTLAILESNDVTAARVDYQKARADAELKESSRKRASLLFENQVLAEKDYRQALADAEMARAELVRTRDRLRILGIDPDGASNRFALPAPRAGVVLDVGAAPGEMSKSLDSPTPLCTLADLSRVWAVGDLYEKDLAGLAPGKLAEVSMNAYPAAIWKGSVAAISDAVDPSTRTLKVRVVLANPLWRLKPEMFGSIRLFRAAAPAVVIPASAVLHDDSSTSVFVEKSPGQYERRPVTVGRTLDQEVEVTSGIKPGEAIVAEGGILLRAATP